MLFSVPLVGLYIAAIYSPFKGTEKNKVSLLSQVTIPVTVTSVSHHHLSFIKKVDKHNHNTIKKKKFRCVKN